MLTPQAVPSMLSNKCRTFKCLSQDGDNGIFEHLYPLGGFLYRVDKKVDILHTRQEVNHFLIFVKLPFDCLYSTVC
jgi:hypothetical protein